MNTTVRPPSGQEFTIQPLRPSELAGVSQPDLSWLWHGYLAPRKVTAMISPSKSGKTTSGLFFLASAWQVAPMSENGVYGSQKELRPLNGSEFTPF